MIQLIKSGEKMLKKEIKIPVSGQIAKVNLNYRHIIFTNGPISPDYAITLTME